MSRRLTSVADAERRARRRLPSSVHGALVAGSEAGVSGADNLVAFSELALATRAVVSGVRPDLTTTVLGRRVSMPVLLSPTGVQAVHPEGEVAVARAAASRGLAVGLSSFANRTVEDVVAVNPAVLFQLHWTGRGPAEAAVERARAAGVVGLVLTLDWSFSEGRDWGSPRIPERVDLRTAVRFAPQALRRPAWLLQHLRARTLPELTTPNTGPPGTTFFDAYRAWQQAPPATWDDVAWLRRLWRGPLLLKGICRVDDARRAVDAGVSAVSVSNHGGNNLDGTPAPVRALPAVAEAVGAQVEVLLDGGVRRGADVVRAVALGARAVMVGRPYLWALAAAGERGVEDVLDLLRDEVASTLRALDRRTPGDVRPEDVLVRPGFRRDLGRA